MKTELAEINKMWFYERSDFVVCSKIIKLTWLVPSEERQEHGWLLFIKWSMDGPWLEKSVPQTFSFSSMHSLLFSIEASWNVCELF